MPRFLGALLTALLLQAASAALAAAALAAQITPEAEHLSRVLDGMNVEKLWLAERYVHWRTGEPLNRQINDNKHHSHCSAFVAAACAKLGVYILRPPEHSTVLLANAQYDWLQGEGKQQGWKPVKTTVEAQHLANQGRLAVAAYRDNDEKKPGHIAIVRPSTKTAAEIESEGPQIIQAGLTNYRSTTLREGFRHHPAAWRDRQVRFFAHDVPTK